MPHLSDVFSEPSALRVRVPDKWQVPVFVFGISLSKHTQSLYTHTLMHTHTHTQEILSS